MKKYDFLLADADDTLLDFGRAEKAAVTKLFAEFGVCADENLLSAYSEHNDRLWKMLERGEISMPVLISTRFTDFFNIYGISGDGLCAAKRYVELLRLQAFKMPGTDELLQKCKGKIRVFIISNGKTEVQLSRFKLSGISDKVEGIFLSEQIGYKKPDKAFFEKAVSSISGFSKEKALVYGDSLTADIAGGINFGVDTCRFNPDGKPNATPYAPDFEVRSHPELYPILGI